MQNKYKLFLKLYIFIFIQSFIFNISFSDQINKFNIIGNERVSDETVIMFSNLEIGDNVNADLLNNTLKELYKTNYFKNVEISFTENTINIKIEENGNMIFATKGEAKIPSNNLIKCFAF